MDVNEKEFRRKHKPTSFFCYFYLMFNGLMVPISSREEFILWV